MHSGTRLGSDDLHRARNQAAAVDRARWLEELAAAVAQAQRLTWRLGVAEGDNEEARGLYGRLEAVLDEVDTLRLSDWIDTRREIDPNWLDIVLTEEMLPAFRSASLRRLQASRRRRRRARGTELRAAPSIRRSRRTRD